MRTASAAWDAYCNDQEGICWRAMRSNLVRLRPAFDLAVAGNPALATKYAGLATLLGVKKTIAKKAVSTKRANKKAVAGGKAPVHVQIGKQRKKAADKAIVAAAQGAPHTVSPAPAGANGAGTTPALNGVTPSH
jgi:hypothetical protein